MMLPEDSDELLTLRAKALMAGFNQATELLLSLRDSEHRLQFSEQASYEYMKGMAAAMLVLIYASAPDDIPFVAAEALVADAREFARAKIEGALVDPLEVH